MSVQPNGAFKKVQPQDYLGRYWILFFYPLDFTFVCPTEILAFNDHYDTFKQHGAELVGISVDSEHAHLAWMNQSKTQGGLGGHLKFPLISDLTKSISRSYGVLLESGVALRGLFIMDKEGKVRHATINDLPIGRSVEEVLRTLKAIQHFDQHGEVCPANWTPGSPTIIPNPKDSKQYFSSKQ